MSNSIVRLSKKIRAAVTLMQGERTRHMMDRKHASSILNQKDSFGHT